MWPRKILVLGEIKMLIMKVLISKWKDKILKSPTFALTRKLTFSALMFQKVPTGPRNTSFKYDSGASTETFLEHTKCILNKYWYHYPQRVELCVYVSYLMPKWSGMLMTCSSSLESVEQDFTVVLSDSRSNKPFWNGFSSFNWQTGGNKDPVERQGGEVIQSEMWTLLILLIFG